MDIRRGRSVAATATAAELDLDGVANVLNGKTCPRLDTAARIAQALGVSLDRFARAWAETRRRRQEREAARAATLEARAAFLRSGKDSS